MARAQCGKASCQAIVMAQACTEWPQVHHPSGAAVQVSCFPICALVTASSLLQCENHPFLLSILLRQAMTFSKLCECPNSAAMGCICSFAQVFSGRLGSGMSGHDGDMSGIFPNQHLITGSWFCSLLSGLLPSLTHNFAHHVSLSLPLYTPEETWPIHL